jgi:hypothetical protein
MRRDIERTPAARGAHTLLQAAEQGLLRSSEMLRSDHLHRGEPSTRHIPDAELGLAAILVGAVILLATILVPIVG